MQRIPTLIGISGHFNGECYPLQYGKTLTVGRSRAADFSLRRTPHYRTLQPDARETDEEAQTVSGKHFQITLHNLRSIEVKNLSPNGTYLDGKPVDSAVLNDLANTVHEIRFGLNEGFKLEMRTHEDAQA